MIGATGNATEKHNISQCSNGNRIVFRCCYISELSTPLPLVRNGSGWLTMNDIPIVHQEVRIVPYQQEWAKRFYWLKQIIIGLLCSEAVECHVHHVGGTAIPGMPSKPIVDVLVIVDSVNLEKARDLLMQVTHYLGECGRPGRHFFSDGSTEHDAAYIHLTTGEHQVAIDQLAFLNMLLSSRDLQRQYADLKTHLAEKYPMDRCSYRMEKGVFIQKCLSENLEEQ